MRMTAKSGGSAVQWVVMITSAAFYHINWKRREVR